MGITNPDGLVHLVLGVISGILFVDHLPQRVGVNTTSPDTVLQVVGNCKFGDDNTDYCFIK